MKTIFLGFGLLVSAISYGQKEIDRLKEAYKSFEADSQFKHAIISLYVVESKTGRPLFDKNSQTGMAPASCQKVVTSSAAFELLGKDYRYKTVVGYDGNISGNTLNGNLIITASGDPAFGSWRWPGTEMDTVLQKISGAVKEKNIKTINGDLVIDDSKWETQATPGGWTWDDMGNYYGAGSRGLNWHENQYDLFLRPGNQTGDSVQILSTDPALPGIAFVNELKTGKPGSGDNSIIYLPENGTLGFVRGTVAGGNKNFKVSGSIPDATQVFCETLKRSLLENNIELKGKSRPALYYFTNSQKMPAAVKTLITHFSPPLDSINYWFLQKSVNLFGEAFVKAVAYEKKGFGATDTGLNIIRDFWAKNGIEKSALHIIDGSGLSPANRLTTNALVTVMQFARNKNWFPSFYKALPEQNGIKMKSGYIGGVRSYTGYIRSVSGAEYTFAFVINNYDGNPGTVREKMWKLLDILK